MKATETHINTHIKPELSVSVCFCRNLVRLMEDRGLSAKRLGDDIGCSHTTILDWIKNGARPRPGMVKRIADYFGTTPQALLQPPGAVRVFTALPEPKDIAAFVREKPAEATELMLRLIEAQNASNDLVIKIKGYDKLTPAAEADATIAEAEAEVKQSRRGRDRTGGSGRKTA
jgi:transcriptional regulator with XRE-family HTH domain